MQIANPLFGIRGFDSEPAKIEINLFDLINQFIELKLTGNAKQNDLSETLLRSACDTIESLVAKKVGYKHGDKRNFISGGITGTPTCEMYCEHCGDWFEIEGVLGRLSFELDHSHADRSENCKSD